MSIETFFDSLSSIIYGTTESENQMLREIEKKIRTVSGERDLLKAIESDNDEIKKLRKEYSDILNKKRSLFYE